MVNFQSFQIFSKTKINNEILLFVSDLFCHDYNFNITGTPCVYSTHEIVARTRRRLNIFLLNTFPPRRLKRQSSVLFIETVVTFYKQLYIILLFQRCT